MSFPLVMTYPGAVDQQLAASAELLSFARVFAYAERGLHDRSGAMMLHDRSSMMRLAAEMLRGLDEHAVRSCITATSRILGTARAAAFWRDVAAIAAPKGEEVLRGL